MPTCTILRDPERTRFTDTDRGVGPAVKADAPPTVRVEVEQIDRSDMPDLVRDPDVIEFAPTMPVRLIEPLAVEADDGQESAWGIQAIGADVTPYTGAGVAVAVLDTGIEATHPAFAGVDLVQMDFTATGDGDRHGHGTHCAGTVFGRDVADQRIGVARGVGNALIGKVLRDDGSGDSDMIFRALDWAVLNGAGVISMSLGFDFPGLVKTRSEQGWPVDLATSFALELYRKNLRLFDRQLAYIRSREDFGGGTVMVAATGNESQRQLDPAYEIAASLPAAADGMVSVAAVGKDGDRLSIAPFSNTQPTIAAPGVGILSAALGGGLTAMSGTSMACPHVAGVAALWWEAAQARGLPAGGQTVVSQLQTTARLDSFADGIDELDRGFGMVTAPE